MTWKAEVERTSESKFVVRHGAKRTKDSTKSVYYCHRSGQFTTDSTGKRQMKTQGSCKSGNRCTAAIVVERERSFQVSYFPQHYGHEKTLGHRTLSLSDRQQSAGKLTQGDPPRRILDDIRTSVTDKVERVHLTTLKDIRNIQQGHGIVTSSAGVHSYAEDHLSECAWVQEMQAKGTDNPVLLFKQQSDVLNDLSVDDFIIIIMTPAQKMMFQKFGHDRLCIDSTHDWL